MSTNMTHPLDAEACWQAVRARDASANGRFYFGVLSTGVFCLPSCPARRPLLRNVRFYRTPAEAQSDGLRPCRRCHPLSPPASARMNDLCRYIEARSGQPLSLADLARHAGLSPSHLQRAFKSAVGLTPRQFHDACRLKSLKTGLRTGDAVTPAVYDAGYGSSSRVYERTGQTLGMTPGQYRRGAQNVSISYATAHTPLGLLMIGATDRGLCFVQFGDSPRNLLAELRAEYPRAAVEPMAQPYPAPFLNWVEALSRHLEGNLPALDLPLDIRATAFQALVWRYLQAIPPGQVRSYTEVAAAVGRPNAARAVARACASNRVALVVPCHRVIRQSGDLGGYRWGLARKRALLKLEGSQYPED